MRVLAVILYFPIAIWSASITGKRGEITVDISTADCLYADTTEPVSIQFFVLEGRQVVEKSEKFVLTTREDTKGFVQGQTRRFTFEKAHSYCKDRKLCSQLSFVGLFAGDSASEVFDTWNANNITVTFNFENHQHVHKFDFTQDGPCMRPLHFWSPEFWHRYGPGSEFEERHEEYAIGDEVNFPTYIL